MKIAWSFRLRNFLFTGVGGLYQKPKKYSISSSVATGGILKLDLFRGDVKIPHSQIVQAAACGQQPYILEHPFTGTLEGSRLLGGCSLHRGHVLTDYSCPH